jgi:A/G-specific adenine glycosylase
MSRAQELTDALRRAFRRDLILWFRAHRRVLPWRTRRTPYRVWISELMLQQTRVEQARAYFLRFMRRFPTIRRLAAARREDVLKMWEGLGYYARARRAHDTARFLVGRENGRFPRTLEGLRTLPGIGPYTAAAIGSLAFGLDAAVVDGNVARVLSRAFASRREPRSPEGARWLQGVADLLLPRGSAGEFNEALMELGATVCAPRNPECPRCPLQRVCKARAAGRQEAYPLRPKRRRVPHKLVGAGLVVDRRGRILIARRKEGSMLGGLWEFPGGTREDGESLEACIARELKEELGIEAAVGPPLIVVRHAFSHFTMDLHAHWARIVRGRPRAIHCDAFVWARVAEMRRYPFPTADLKILAAVEAQPELLAAAARKAG